ncbi:MAG: preprotein translocase subunit SecG, partial [Oscillospiraceae bacterium]
KLMSGLEITGGILLLIASILIIIIVIFQESKQSGLSGVDGQASDSYYSKNKGKSKEAKLKRITTILAIIFFVLTLALNLIIAYVK